MTPDLWSLCPFGRSVDAPNRKTEDELCPIGLPVDTKFGGERWFKFLFYLCFYFDSAVR